MTKKRIILAASAAAAVVVLAAAGFWLSRRSSAVVKVYDFNMVGMTEYWGGSKGSYGPVSTDKVQTAFLTDTQEDTEVCVQQGDVVKKGDLLMRFDTTLSDLAVERTRLDVVKDMFATFVASRPDDLIGLVTFGGYASSRAPLTADHETLLHVLKGVEIPSQSFDAQGNPVDPEETMTAVGDGLSMALARLKNAEVKSKIVILLSDGVSNTGAVEPAQAAEAAAKMGIKAYVIGVGTKSRRVPCRVKDAFGRWTVAYADMAFDESQLKSIAKTTGGRYFAVDDADGLKAALEEIDSLEKTTLDRTTYQRYREFFPPFLLWGAALVLAAISIQMAASRRLL